MYELTESIMDSSKEYYQTNPSRFSLQISLISTVKYREVDDFMKSIDMNGTSNVECFESEFRFDFGIFLFEQEFTTELILLKSSI